MIRSSKPLTRNIYILDLIIWIGSTAFVMIYTRKMDLSALLFGLVAVVIALIPWSLIWLSYYQRLQQYRSLLFAICLFFSMCLCMFYLFQAADIFKESPRTSQI